MKSVDLNANWNIVTAESEYICDLPHDVTAQAVRDYTCAFGELNGYIPAAKASFIKTLPVVRHGRATLVISGALGYGDVYVNDEHIGALASYAPVSFDLTDKLGFSHNVLRLEMFSAPGMNDKYVGLGVGGDVKLVTEETLDFEYGSLFVKTTAIGDKTYADVEVAVHNDGPAGKFLLEAAVTNPRGKRCGKKQRKIFVGAGRRKMFTVRVRITRAYEWTPTDPYIYGLNVKLVSGEAETTAYTKFGIVSRNINPYRGLYINGKNIKLFGAYVSHADAALGGVSLYSGEKRRFDALKSIGYNAVHFTECPTEAALAALDDAGMYAFVDVFDSLIEGKAPLDNHIFFDEAAENVAAESVRVMRNHPCVTVYGIADDVPECYGRHGGHAVIERLAKNIKAIDCSRPLTVSAREFVPTQKELDDAGIKRRVDSPAAAINAGREKDLFGTLTKDAFDNVDVCGFNYLYPLYASDKVRYDRVILGSRTSPERAFESIDETEKNALVIGDFCDCGIDYPGAAKQGEIYNTGGDIDAVLDVKPQGKYKKIALGARGEAFIAALDPDTEEPVEMWNWPRHLGKQVTVQVYTSGDVVALYLDNRLIGRKLAGKINRHVATFKVDYYPGKLEAVCYFKGVECARATLATASSPKIIKLSAYEKTLYLSRGDIGFISVDVCDKDGNIVPYAMRTLSALVTGGRLVSFINADPLLRKGSFDTCPAYGGKALCAVKPDAEGKLTVKISGEGLLASRISFKVKDA